jgi:hypothetical protein
MTDPWGEPARPAPDAVCPWCSAELKNNPATCPSCGAQLHEEAAAEVPGVTQLDPAAGAVARPAPRSRGLLGWLSGEYEAAEGSGERDSISPPSEAVRAEMARLEIAAIQAQIDADAAAEAAAADDAATAAEATAPEAGTPETVTPAEAPGAPDAPAANGETTTPPA